MSTQAIVLEVASDAHNGQTVSYSSAKDATTAAVSPETGSSPQSPSLPARSETLAAAAAAAAAASQPRSGTLIPNRVFVGGIPSSTSEAELKEFFSAYGEVRDVKIIVDKSGLSKGYGFVTFESAEVAECIIQRDSLDGLVFRQRKLNIGPAIKKHPLFTRPDPSSSGVFFTSGSVPYTYQNGMAVFHSVYQAQQLPGCGELQYAQPAYSVAAAAASSAPPGGQTMPAAAQLMCLPAAPFAAVWPTANTQSPIPAQSNAPSNTFYSTAFGAVPCYGSPLPRTPAMGPPGTEGTSFLSATSDYGTDPSYTDQSYANEPVDYDCTTVYHYHQQHPQQLAATAFSPAYCYGSPPVLCPVRAYPVLLNPTLATPPPPAPVVRIAGATYGVGFNGGRSANRPASAEVSAVCESVDDFDLLVNSGVAAATPAPHPPLRLPGTLVPANVSHSS